MKLYHYTQPENWEQISGKSSITVLIKLGLIPRTPFGGHNRNRVIHGLLKPIPKEWIGNQEFPEVFDGLMSHTDRVLLEIEVDQYDESIFVVDWAILERVRRSKPNEYSDDQVIQARIDYYASAISLAQYLQNSDLNYGLPEVIIARIISPELVSVSSHQKMLEKQLRTVAEIAPIHLETNLQRYSAVPELQPLIESYRANYLSNPELKIA